MSLMRHAHGGAARPAQQVRSSRSAWPRLFSLIVATFVVVAALAAGWSLLWYYAADVANRTLTGWVQREADAGRTYTCGKQVIDGFPFRIRARCVDASAVVSTAQGPVTVHAGTISFTAPIYHPTLLTGDVEGPLTAAQSGQPSLRADWSLAQVTLRGLPFDPEAIGATVDAAHLDRGADAAPVFAADHADVEARIIAGSARDHPTLEVTFHFNGATAPSVHPLLAQPLKGDIDAVVHGLKDFAPKTWPERFHEMQEAGGSIEIKSVRLDQVQATIIGTGTLTINAHGKVDGLVSIAVAGIDNIIPLLGIDKVIGQGIDRLAGLGGQSGQGLGTLDRLMPGLSDVVRDTTNANLVENLKKMGQPTEIDKKPAIVLPLRVADGSIYLGMVPLGDLPALF